MTPGAIRSQRWRAAHPGANAAHQRAYIERHPKAQEAHTVRQRRTLRQAVFDRDEGLCRVERWGEDGAPSLCMQPVDPDNWEMDHILPVLAGGPSVIDNLRVAHPMCNRRRKRVHSEDEILELCGMWTQNELARTRKSAEGVVALIGTGEHHDGFAFITMAGWA